MKKMLRFLMMMILSWWVDISLYTLLLFQLPCCLGFQFMFQLFFGEINLYNLSIHCYLDVGHRSVVNHVAIKWCMLDGWNNFAFIAVEPSLHMKLMGSFYSFFFLFHCIHFWPSMAVWKGIPFGLCCRQITLPPKLGIIFVIYHLYIA